MGVANALRDAGYVVYEACNAAEAIDIVTAGVVPDVLFTDVLLPGRLDGLQLAALLESSLPGLVVIVSSGRLISSDVKLPLNFLAKPFEPRGVVRHISRALQR
jgi:CheY-like chemotaxis protein